MLKRFLENRTALFWIFKNSMMFLRKDTYFVNKIELRLI